MRLASNSVNPNDVVEETRDGDRFLIVKSVPFVRAQNLSGGYVPDSEIRASTKAWAGRLLTANHPRDSNGTPVPADTKKDETAVGYAENPEYDGEYVRADMAVNADRAESLGGHASDIVTKIENGETFDVSSQYFPKDLPSGEYDGAYRANVEGIQEPDSIALLPHKPGKCSLDQGCGINPSPEMVANSEVSIPVADDPDTGEETGEDSIMTDDLDLENPDDETKRNVGERVLGVFGWGTDGDEGGNEPAESGVDVDSDMNDKTAELVANHGFDADNLPSEETECFGRIYEAVTSNDDETDETEEQEAETEDGDNSEVIQMTEEEFTQRIDARVEERAEELVANREAESEKEEIATEIVANSAEYDDVESVTEDFPTVAALETKKEQVTDTGAMPGTGVTPNVESDEYDDIAPGVYE